MTTDTIYEERVSDWSHQVSAVVTTRWLQHDQTLPLSEKGVACEARWFARLGVIPHKCISLELATAINVMPHHTLTGQMMGIIWGFD